MSFGPDFIQPPAKLNFRNTYRVEDTAASSIRSNEIYYLNRDHKDDWREWQEAHQ